ncbi:MAG: chromate transporter [Limnochordaceae bacterium]|nr:chromate transporter [Limnochordaceae bacterium]
MVLLDLFVTFFRIGAFSFGGGYAMIPLIEREIIDAHHWLTMEQFIDVVAISQATPGPVAINSATFVGYRVAGLLGSIVATAGVVVPSAVIVLLLAWLFYRYRELLIVKDLLSGIRPVVVVLIIMAAISVWASSVVDLTSGLIAVAALAVLAFTKVDPLLVLLGGALLGLLIG